MPIPIKSIEITRAEGPIELCGETKTFTNFEEATAYLISIAHTFPITGGYDKTDFIITWEDGQDYSGTLDCKHISCPDNDLDVYQHVLTFANYCAGLIKNHYLGRMAYRNHLIDLEKRNPGNCESWRHLIKTYLICPEPESLGTFCKQCNLLLNETETELCVYCKDDNRANRVRDEQTGIFIRMFRPDTGTEPDVEDVKDATSRLTLRDCDPDPRIGDYAKLEDGTYKRIAHVWENTIQLTDDGSFYIGYGEVSMSGSLDTGILRDKFILTAEKKPGTFWFFHHDDHKAHNGVGVEAFCRVYEILD